MSDDIVTRLRERGEWDAHPMGGREWFPDELCEEAADEIERLRAEVTRLGSFLHPVGVRITTHGTLPTIHERDMRGLKDDKRG